MSAQKKILFNMNWDLDTNGVRKLELDALKGLNSNINNLGVLYSPIDGTTNKSDITLFLARKRLIHLMDSWNRILNSGLFLEGRIATAQPNSYYKIIGSNVLSPSAEYLFKDWNISRTYHYKLDFKTESIFYRMVRFLVACVNNHNWFVANNVSKSSSIIVSKSGYNFSINSCARQPFLYWYLDLPNIEFSNNFPAVHNVVAGINCSIN